MADRTVTVRLRMDAAQYQRALAGAAAQTSAFGKSADGSGKQIDKLSGRLKLLTDASLTLGPALIPIGASAIPVLTASLVGLSSAAGAIGVTVLAFNGLGDALKALDKAQLEPTAENLEAMRVEMEKLGPAGAHFAHFVDNLEPQMRDLQMVAREGLFPGVEDGITDLLTRLPQVKRTVADLAEGMGDLARDAGESLSGEDWTPFFDYMESDARPTLEAFARSAGNVALGIANMLTAFAPLNRDFTGGLEDATQAFADWSKGLDDNESFQEFLSYVRESGPQVIDFLAALGSAVVGLIKAAAPMGQVVLPALTGMAKAFALIANSPIGPGLYIAAAAMVAFNRAAKIADATTTRLSTTFGKMSKGQLIGGSIGGLGLLAASMSDLDDKAGLANTAMFSMAGLMVGGPWGLAVGGGIGLVADLAAANDDLSAAVTAANDAMNTGEIDEMRLRYEQLGDEIKETEKDAANVGLRQDIGSLGDVVDVLGAQWSKLTGETDDAKDTFADLGGEIGHTVNDVGLFSTGVLDAEDSVQQLSGALSELQGWFDKRAAIRDYRDSLRELSKGIKDGFGREDVEALDAVGENIAQVANAIKDPALRQDFLAGAMSSLSALAEKSGPKARAAIQRVIDKLVDLGLVKATPEVGVKDHASAALAAIQRAIDALHGKTIKIYTQHLTSGTPDPAPGTPEDLYGGTDGGTVPRSGRPYADRYNYLLADGEEVVSNRYGQADRHRALLKKINAGMADGGTVGATTARSQPGGNRRPDDAIQIFVAGVWSAAKALKAMQAELERSEKALDKERQSRDDLQSQFDSIKSQVGSAYSTMDPFAASTGSVWGTGANPLATFDKAVAGNTASTQAAQTALDFAATNGLDGPLYAALAASGNLPLLQQFAKLSASEIETREQAFAAQSNAEAALGGMAAEAQVGTQLAAANRRLDKVVDEVKAVRHAVNALDQNNQKAQDKNAKDVKDGVNGAAANGRRRGRR